VASHGIGIAAMSLAGFSSEAGAGVFVVGAPEAIPVTRTVSLDALRGLAALSVVACHYSILLCATPYGRHVAPWLALPPFSLLSTAYGSVILFFVLSGYVLALSLTGDGGSNWLGFAARRFCRIWPPYALTILASFLIGWIAVAADPLLPPVWQENVWHHDTLALSPLVEQIGMATPSIPLDVPGWSLVYELRISLFFPLLLALVRRAPATALAAAIFLNVAGQIGPPWLSQLVPETATYIVYFTVGAWLALNRAWIAERGRAMTGRDQALLGAIALLCLSLPRGYPGVGMVTGLGAVLIIALAIASPPFARVLSARWCGFLGRISYSLYLTHVVVLMGVGALLGGSLPVALVLVVATPIIGLVAWSGHRWVEQPSIRLGRAVAARLARSPLKMP